MRPRPAEASQELRPARRGEPAAARCVAAAEEVCLRPQAAAEAASFFAALSPAPFPFPAPAEWQARPEASVRQAAALLPGEQAERDVVAGLPEAEERVVGAPPQAAEHVAGQRPAAEHAAALQEAAVEEEVVVVPDAAEAAKRAARMEVEVVRRSEAPGAPVALPSAVRWVAAWAFHRDPTPPWPAPRPAAWSARAMAQRPVASP